MEATLNLINKLIANAEPDNYDNISYSKYFADLANISDSILADNRHLLDTNTKILAQLHDLPDSEIKNNLIALCLESLIAK